MHALLRQMLATARARGLFPAPGLAVVAVSGGPDSVALIHALHELAAGFGLELLVAHLDHGLRGTLEGGRDAAQVGELAGKLGLPVEVGIRQVTRPRGASLEETARRVRYAFLGEVAARHRARYLAIAHTADDQAETLLMRLLRGAGPRGLQAMTPITMRAQVAVVRPLLDAPRDLVRSYLSDRRLAFRLDRTNRDLRLERNRIRHVLVPLLSSEFNPSVVASLGRTAEIMNEVDEHLTALANAALDSGILCAHSPSPPDSGPLSHPGGLPTPPYLVLDLDRLSTYDRILQRTLIREAILRLRRDLRGIGFDHVDALLGLTGRRSRGRRVELPGGVIGLREGNRLSLWAADPGEARSIPLTPLALEGEVVLPEAGLTVRTRLVKLPQAKADLIVNVTSRAGHHGLARAEDHRPLQAENHGPGAGRGTGEGDMGSAMAAEKPGNDPVCAVFDRSELTLPIAVRSRRQGDRFFTGTGKGEKKIKDVLIDARVPRRLRAAVPLLVDGAGGQEERILWVAGIRRSAHAPVDETTSEILEVRISTRAS